MKNIDEEYYGYRDEDDGVILPLETEAEKNGKSLSRLPAIVYSWYQQFVFALQLPPNDERIQYLKRAFSMWHIVSTITLL